MKKHLAVTLSILALLISILSAYLAYTTKQFVYDTYQVMGKDVDIKIIEAQLKFLEDWKLTNERFFRQEMCEMGNREFCGKEE